MGWESRTADRWGSLLVLSVLLACYGPSTQAQQSKAPTQEGTAGTIPASSQEQRAKELSIEERKRLEQELLREPPAKELIKNPPTGPVGLRMEMADGIKLSWFSSGPVTLRNYRVYRVEPNGIRTLLTKVPYKRLPDLERIEVVLPASSASSLDDIYVSAVSWYGYESGLMGHGRRYLPPSQVKFDD